MYRHIVYIIAILIITFQSYLIWEDRLNVVTYVKYSHTINGIRTIDSCIVEVDIKYVSDINEVIVEIIRQTNAQNVLLESWQRIYKDRPTRINWKGSLKR